MQVNLKNYAETKSCMMYFAFDKCVCMNCYTMFLNYISQSSAISSIISNVVTVIHKNVSCYKFIITQCKSQCYQNPKSLLKYYKHQGC